jgi:chondroitin AC lyase
MKRALKILVWFFFSAIATTTIGAPTDFEIIKKRVVEDLVQPGVNDTEIKSLTEQLQEDGTWPGIDYEDVSNEGFQHSRHYSNMVNLARAYRKSTSAFYKSEEVRSAIEHALKNWVDNDYICENWWFNQIGTPDNLVDVLLLAGSDLPQELVDKTQPIIGRANIDAPGARPGGDRIKIAGIQAKNMLFLGERETFEKVVRVIENEIKYVEWIGKKYGYTYRRHPGGFGNRSAGGRGIQYGNSFHHRTDGVNNTLSYGIGYANAFVEWAVYTAGTRFAFAEEKLSRLVDYYLDGICKTAVFGKYPDPGAKNRSVSRRGTLRPYSAKIAEDLLFTTNYRKDELQEIADIRNKGIIPTLSHATFFWNSEHFSFQRPGWFASVRMYSTRNHNMEVPYNSEGLLNHHRGDGANHISRTGDEYYDIFPVFDYQKVPGTTIMQKPELPDPNQIQKIGLTDFVGAVTDSLYGAVAFDFKSPHDPLIARKAWFFFDELFVCLGAGISCKNGSYPVVTTINQCLLKGDVHVSWDQWRGEAERGERQFPGASWVFHDGVGYIFPNISQADPYVMNKEVTGSWRRISKQSSTPKNEVTKDVFKLWIDHGVRPSDASYEYIVLPSATLDETSNYLGSGSDKIHFLVNTPELQAVKHTGSNICQAVFYEAGELQISEGLKIVAHNPGIIMLKMKNGAITEISLADPNRELGRFHLSVSEKIEKHGDNFSAVWNEKDRLSRISVKLPENNYAGDSSTIEL